MGATADLSKPLDNEMGSLVTSLGGSLGGITVSNRTSVVEAAACL